MSDLTQEQIDVWSEAPEWANWIAKDSDGCYWFYDEAPCIDDIRFNLTGDRSKQTGKKYSSHNWRESLQSREEHQKNRDDFLIMANKFLGAHEGFQNAYSILDKAQSHMLDRAATYDPDEENGERSITRAREAFNIITGDGLMSTDERGWLFMAILKMVRAQSGGLRMDSYEDGAAYFALAGESAAAERGGNR